MESPQYLFYYSAASLALVVTCIENRKLISLALSGEPPFQGIAEELRDLMENINFFRHLELKGIELAENEVQLVIAGKGIGFGYAKAEGGYRSNRNIPKFSHKNC